LLLAADFWLALGMWAALGANGPYLPLTGVQDAAMQPVRNAIGSERSIFIWAMTSVWGSFNIEKKETGGYTSFRMLHSQSRFVFRFSS
jgi:hypothetical protein